MAFTIKNPTAPATEAQVTLYAKLVTQIQVATLGMDPIEATKAATLVAAAMTKGEISTAIDTLMVSAKAVKAIAPKADTSSVEPGYYAKGDTVYVVVTSKSSGKPYAKQWTAPAPVVESFDLAHGFTKTSAKAKWEYAPGAVQTLVGLTPMTLAEAKEWGHLHGYCVRCGAPLSDPKSVEAGIGPICAKSFA